MSDTNLRACLIAALVWAVLQMGEVAALRQQLHVLSFSIWGQDYARDLSEFEKHPDFPLTPRP